MKDKILKKSVELFFTIGVKTTTMDDIAQELGMSKKTLYEYFQNKNQLVEEVSLWITKNISEIISEVKSYGYNPIQEYVEIFKKIDAFFEFNKNESCNKQFMKFYPKIYEKTMRRHMELMDKTIMGNYKKGLKEGLYKAFKHPELLPRFFNIGMEEIHQFTKFEDLHIDIRSLKKEFLNYHLNALLTDKGKLIFNDIKSDFI